MAQAVTTSEIQPDIFSNVTALLENAVEEGVFPGAVLLVGKNGDVVYKKAVGMKAVASAEVPAPPKMTDDTVFDIAALTGTMVTTTIFMKLLEAGKVKLDDRVSRYIQGFSVFGKSGITIAHLLSHTSGLLHWHPFFEELIKEHQTSRMGILTSRGAREFIFNAITRSEPKTEPGVKELYSDIGFMLLGQLVETLTGQSLDRAAHHYVFQPLGLKSTSYVDLSMIKRRGIHPVKDVIAPTEYCPWRKRVLWGEVHDDNAWVMGGIAGHSGVFSSAADLHVFGSEMIRAYSGNSSYLTRGTVERFWRSPAVVQGGSWRLGWDTPSEENAMNESNLTERAIGASGFTGCSLWLEPEVGVDIVLLSNRVHPNRSNRKIRTFRPAVHNAVLEALGTL